MIDLPISVKVEIGNSDTHDNTTTRQHTVYYWPFMCHWWIPPQRARNVELHICIVSLNKLLTVELSTICGGVTENERNYFFAINKLYTNCTL